MSLFGDLDVASAADDPFAVDNGTYEATVTKCSVGLTKAEDKTGMTIEYTITSGTMEDRSVTEWKLIPSPDLEPKEMARAKSFLKQRLLNLGIPEDRINSVEVDDLIGIDCVITIKNKDGYTNVGKVELPLASKLDAGSDPWATSAGPSF